MNKFTKAELEYLHSCPSVAFYEGLYEKIQSMIDNYCENESDGLCYTGKNIDTVLNKCVKCKEMYRMDVFIK